MNERTVVAMKDDGVCFIGVHGDTIMFADIVQRQNVGNAMWIKPYPFWIVTQEALFIDRDSAGITMNINGVIGWCNVVKQVFISNHVDRRTTVNKETPIVDCRSLNEAFDWTTIIDRDSSVVGNILVIIVIGSIIVTIGIDCQCGITAAATGT